MTSTLPGDEKRRAFSGKDAAPPTLRAVGILSVPSVAVDKAVATRAIVVLGALRARNDAT